MVSSQRSAVPSTPVRASVAAGQPLAGTPGLAGVAVRAARGPRWVAPMATRRDPVRPGGRASRVDAPATARRVQGGCSVPGVARAVVAPRAPRYDDRVPGQLRLTRRGRRALSGLSIAIGLSIAAVTVCVELGDDDGGLQLAGSSTVVVQPGDTLWDLAQEVAPQEDPRAVVDAIVDLNGLRDVDLVPGMQLRLP
jgi:nucleoid-associated protein YgaU